MPDFRNFTITRLTNATVTVPRWRIEGTVNDSTTGALIHDFAGANAINFPGVLTTLTADEREEFLQLVLNWLIFRATGAGG